MTEEQFEGVVGVGGGDFCVVGVGGGAEEGLPDEVESLAEVLFF